MSDSVDVLVVGGGMAGLAVAARAAGNGARVTLVEKADAVGGSALLSGGNIWTVPTDGAFLAEDPYGDVAKYRLMRAGLPASLDWLGSLGIKISELTSPVLPAAVGGRVDMPRVVTALWDATESDGGRVLTGCTPAHLIVDDGRVRGAVVGAAGGGRRRVSATITVLATGGFGASVRLQRSHLKLCAHRLALRANPHSDGGGLALALAAGGRATERMDGFYGHLVPAPLPDFGPADYRKFAQYHSVHGLLLDRSGRRFTDESRGDHHNNVAVSRRGPALLVVDSAIHGRHATSVPPFDGFDRMRAAAPRGARFCEAGSIERLASCAAGWGYDAAALADSVHTYNRAVHAGTPIRPGRVANRVPIEAAPFLAVEVQATMTHTYGGILTDTGGRVLGRDDRPVPGLYAAGIDSGGHNCDGYTGGLVRGLVFGRHIGNATDLG